jgi:hypothetical protein
MDYKKVYENIQIHVEMLVTPEMRAHACADANAHDLSFQIFRLLNGYDQALQKLKETNDDSEKSVIGKNG